LGHVGVNDSRPLAQAAKGTPAKLNSVVRDGRLNVFKWLIFVLDEQSEVFFVFAVVCLRKTLHHRLHLNFRKGCLFEETLATNVIRLGYLFARERAGLLNFLEASHPVVFKGAVHRLIVVAR